MTRAILSAISAWRAPVLLRLMAALLVLTIVPFVMVVDALRVLRGALRQHRLVSAPAHLQQDAQD